jgi:hypothetical protein
VSFAVSFADSVLFSAFINLMWPTFFGGCDITRPTDQWLRDAGDWEEVALRAGEGEGSYHTLPHSLGMLVKRK